jgi:hyperosmotically inducible periplasmic protein
MKSNLLIVTIGLISLVGCYNSNRPVSSSTTPAPSTASGRTSEPDNTSVNERDRNSDAKTPIDQNENQKDVGITADIRKQILAHDDMSVNARNAKIITADGKVTLRGPVDSTSERDVIEKIARDVAGKDNVDNQLEVAAK